MSLILQKASRAFGIALAVYVWQAAANAQSAQVVWTVSPSYQTRSADTALRVTADDGSSAELYTESHAVLILEGKYVSNATFPDVSTAAGHAESLLRPALERDGFQVLVWSNASGKDLKKIIDDVFDNYGNTSTGRLFFYYFGHGTVTGGEDNAETSRAWLVPVDAPNPASHEDEFYRMAMPMSYIVYHAQNALVKHAFFAFEACHAGNVISSLYSLGPVQPPHGKGYILSPDTQRPVKQFLTAGDALRDIPADNSFTALLVGALRDPQADVNGDGYITGKKIMTYVEENLPRWAPEYRASPESGSIPRFDGGDMVFGPVEALGRHEPSNSSATPSRSAGAGASALALSLTPAPRQRLDEDVAYVFFDFDRSDLTARARQVVENTAHRFVEMSESDPSMHIEIDGFMDRSIPTAYAQKLSVREAESVEAELVRDGVARGAIELHGYGSEKPLVATAAGVREPQNRRVEIRFAHKS